MLLGYTVGYNKTEMSLKKESKSKSQVSGLGVVGVVGVVDVGTVVGIVVVFGSMTAVDDGGGGSVVGVYDRERKRETGLILLW